MDGDKATRLLKEHMAQWASIADRINRQMAPLVEASNMALRQYKLLQLNSKFLHDMTSQVFADATTMRVAADAARIASEWSTQLTQLRSFADTIALRYQEAISPAFRELQKSFVVLPQRTQKAILLLGRHGWYFDLDMSFPDLWELQKLLEAGDTEGADQWLCEYYEHRVEDIQSAVNESYPHRARFINAAFTAHLRGEFELSIPLLLAQVDGICKEVSNRYLFRRQDKRPGTAVLLEGIAAGSFRAALLAPLAEVLPISASEREREGDFNELNRHLVLHGESLDYPSRINGLKAISLINYVIQALEKVKKNP